jgi:hypothetical protein
MYKLLRDTDPAWCADLFLQLRTIGTSPSHIIDTDMIPKTSQDSSFAHAVTGEDSQHTPAVESDDDVEMMMLSPRLLSPTPTARSKALFRNQMLNTTQREKATTLHAGVEILLWWRLCNANAARKISFCCNRAE